MSSAYTFTNTETFQEIDVASTYTIKFLSSSAYQLVNTGGTLQFKDNGGTARMTLSQAGALAVSGGFTVLSGLTVSGGTVSLPTGSITSTMILDNTISSADINTEAMTAAKQLKFVSATAAAANSVVADCTAGYTAISGAIVDCTVANSASLINCGCLTSTCTSCASAVADIATARYWLLQCKTNTTHTVNAVCMRQ